MTINPEHTSPFKDALWQSVGGQAWQSIKDSYYPYFAPLAAVGQFLLPNGVQEVYQINTRRFIRFANEHPTGAYLVSMFNIVGFGTLDTAMYLGMIMLSYSLSPNPALLAAELLGVKLATNYIVNAGHNLIHNSANRRARRI